MKKKISMLLAFVLVFACVFALASCGKCEHRDADDNGICDLCEEPFTDSCDVHRDANDDGKCDNGGEAYTDQCDFHVDATDDKKCDKCDTAFDDGCSFHVDADDNAKCDKCDTVFEDGEDMATVKFMKVNGSSVTMFSQGTIKVPKNSKFTEDNLAAIRNIVYRGVGVEVWYTDKAMTQPFDLANTVITANMELYGVPSAKAGFNVSYTLDEATGVLTFTGSGDMFSFQSTLDVPWLKDGKNAKIKSVVISEGITSLSNNMLAGATNITTISLPSTIKRIGENAFSGSGITGIVVLNDGLETIDRHAFSGAKHITGVVIPKSLKNVGYAAFEGSGLVNLYYKGLKSNFDITLANTNDTFVSAVANYYSENCPATPGPFWYYGTNNAPANWCYALKYYVGDAETPEWIDYVFVSGAKATKNNINFRENSITKNGYKFQKIEPALELNQAITSDMKFICYRGNIYSEDGNIYSEYRDGKLTIGILNVEEGTTEAWDILDKADVGIFAENSNDKTAMTSVTSLEIAQGITYIGKYMFAGMTGVETVFIPASVTQIHADAFDGCVALKAIYYGGTNNLQIVNDNGKVIGVLNGCDAIVYTKVLVGENEDGNWYKIYNEDTEDEKILAWTIDSGVLYVGGDAVMVDFEEAADAPWYIVKDSLNALVILDGVTHLGENMVNGYEGIESVTIPASVKDIPASALAGTGYKLNAAQ